MNTSNYFKFLFVAIGFCLLGFLSSCSSEYDEAADFDDVLEAEMVANVGVNTNDIEVNSKSSMIGNCELLAATGRTRNLPWNPNVDRWYATANLVYRYTPGRAALSKFVIVRPNGNTFSGVLDRGGYDEYTGKATMTGTHATGTIRISAWDGPDRSPNGDKVRFFIHFNNGRPMVQGGGDLANGNILNIVGDCAQNEG